MPLDQSRPLYSVQELIARTAPLLSLIRRAESNNSYDAIVWLVNRSRYPGVAITTMTVGEVLEWQDRIDHHQNSEAVGAYQIMEDTLRGLYARAGVQLNEPFNAEVQDELAVALLQRRGLDDYLAGDISAERFANNLAKEWASLPVVTVVARRSGNRTWNVAPGASYYSGDSVGNKAHVSKDEIMAAVQAIKAAPPRAVIEPERPSWTPAWFNRKPEVRPDAIYGYTPNGLMIYRSVQDVPSDGWKWRYFKPSELACKGTGRVAFCPAALTKFDQLRTSLGEPVYLTSFYRSPEHNAAVGGAKASKHMEGIAGDGYTKNWSAEKRARYVRLAGKVGFSGIGLYEDFVHADDRRYEARW